MSRHWIIALCILGLVVLAQFAYQRSQRDGCPKGKTQLSNVEYIRVQNPEGKWGTVKMAVCADE